MLRHHTPGELRWHYAISCALATLLRYERTASSYQALPAKIESFCSQTVEAEPTPYPCLCILHLVRGTLLQTLAQFHCPRRISCLVAKPFNSPLIRQFIQAFISKFLNCGAAVCYVCDDLLPKYLAYRKQMC